jgi:DNA N-6-adenine-methyltransferase (Dam)/Protein of unknown function (DUF3102)
MSGPACGVALVLPDRDLASEINQAHADACRVATSAIEYARRCGDLLIEAKASMSHGDWLPWLESHCPDLSARVAQGYMRIAAKWSQLDAANTNRDSHLPIRDALKLLTPPRETYNTGQYEWFTPADVIAAARAVLGVIDLDPASTEDANAIVQAVSYFTVTDDGLRQPWRGRVWLNPPFARPLIDPFADKLVASVTAGDVTAAITITNNATDTQWVSTLVSVAAAVCFPRGRVKFWQPHVTHDAGPLQGQAILYVGPAVDRFREGFRSFGSCWVRDDACGLSGQASTYPTGGQP